MRTAILLILLCAFPARAVELRPGDHICLVGNTLAERMQHDGWMEAHLHAAFPEHNLTVRNLGFSGDEITKRLRSANFGSPDDWLKRCRADVVFAFFGYNESFAGPAGLPKFRAELDDYLKHLASQKYNGTSAPRVVLFSPVRFHNPGIPSLHAGTEINANIELYSAAMEKVARANGVDFVSLEQPATNKGVGPLTFNGIHLNEAGAKEVARIVTAKLTGGRAVTGAERLRDLVNQKNAMWFQRYRTTDGYSIFGGRADLKFVNDQTNRVVAQREMEILDVGTANRDKVIWAAARIKDKSPWSETDRKAMLPDDSNVPAPIPVITNKPGNGPGGKHLFLSGEESIKAMKVGPGLKVNLFASEEQFPYLVNPVQMTWDAQGRLWVAVWQTYPHALPTEPANDKILIFEDTDGDGKADKMTVFADRLHNPTGFELVNGGVIVANVPDLIFLKDTDGDGKADVRERILHGLDSADTHHAANSFVLDPGGALYMQEGTFHHTQVETPWGPPLRNANAGVYRFEPRSYRFETYVAFGFANPHGHAFDRWGQDIVVDGTGSQPYHAALFSGHLPYPMKHPAPPQVYQQRTRPCPGIEVVSSRHLPDDWQGHMLVGNVIGFQGVLRYRIDDDGASFQGVEQEPVLSSSDPNFRPSDIKIGPDGAIYISDWHNPIIGHMQHNLRDPSRDRTHGRIYRVSHEGRPLSRPPAISGRPVRELLDLLKHPEARVRYRVRGELGSRDSDTVMKELDTWTASLDPKDPEVEHHRLESLWVRQWHDRVTAADLKPLLNSPDFRAQAGAVRVMCYQRHRVPEALDLLRTAASARHPRVRLEAARAASFLTNPEAVEVLLLAKTQPTDRYLDFVITESHRVLDPLWKSALVAGKRLALTTDAGRRFIIREAPIDQLLEMPRDMEVLAELLTRPGLGLDLRKAALRDLAARQKSTEGSILISVVRQFDGRPDVVESPTALADLVRIAAGLSDSKVLRRDWEQLATSARRAISRQAAFVALALSAGSIEPAWELARKSPGATTDWLASLPMLPDPALRTAAYPRVLKMLDGTASTESSSPPIGRFVRIDLPGRQRTLSLAEVEVISAGTNVAPQGRATQKSTASGGQAKRAIDRNTSGIYTENSVTHTQENIADPWWEVDLGSAVPVESVVVWNRTDGKLGRRLDGFTVTILDDMRRPVAVAGPFPAPESKRAIAIAGNDSPIRRAAMNALTSVRGRESETFAALARFVSDPADRDFAILALQKLPRADWPRQAAPALIDSLTRMIAETPVGERTGPAATSALDFADSLAALLPPDDARKARARLGELGIRVIRVGTLPERMSYDKDTLTLKAGQRVEFLFENSDFMPHNFVIAQPGTLEAVGNAAEADATSADAAARHYVPRLPAVLLSSKLIQPGRSERLAFTAPREPGVYPYVCTYPGHWRTMYGALYVVADQEAFQAGPDAYLVAHGIAAKDPLLKDRRTRTEWKYEDLAETVATMTHGRSFANGRSMFGIANCVACHKLDGVGQEYGPDLMKIDPKWTPLDIWREMVDPSARINEKYQSYVIQLASGQTVTGLIVEETADAFKIVDNPVAGSKPITIRKSDIEAREKSPSSLMPKGLLDKLSRDEILDLIAYVNSRGNKEHTLFGTTPGTGHRHGGGR
ncbi:MAG: HEAT repeat domain-containing protein [Gemmataceae bacterium]|nr:HEAT repeat domain-containing protein [Gemmataceae bacterium]